MNRKLNVGNTSLNILVAGALLFLSGWSFADADTLYGLLCMWGACLNLGIVIGKLLLISKEQSCYTKK